MSPSTLLNRIRTSTWAPIVVRVGAVIIALVVLGWIGRAAAAGSGASALDAGAPSLAPSSSPALAPAPAPVPAPAPAPAPASASPSRSRASPTDPVFINHAGVDELRRLPGVGAKRAEAILVLRQRLGRFQRVEDLLRVKGVGRGTVKKWRPLLRLDAPAPPASALADGGAT